MDYNTQRPTLLMPEYGRMVQQMVDEAVKIKNRAERQAYAESIVSVMCGLNPQMKNVPGYREKLWDHIAYISGYKLDIDYPCQICRPEQENPPSIPYPDHQMRFRHYGSLIEHALAEVSLLPPSLHTEILRGIGTRMKRCVVEFRCENPDDCRIEHDIERISDDAVKADFSMYPLAYIRMENKEGSKKRKKR